MCVVPTSSAVPHSLFPVLCSLFLIHNVPVPRPLQTALPRLLLAATLLLASPAAALTPKQEARALFRQGNSLVAAGDFKRALRKYIRARTLYPSYKIDLNIAATLYSLGRLAAAARNFERFLQRAGDRADRRAVATARERLGELRRKLSSITVSCPVAGAQVIVDGRLAGHTPLTGRIYLLPGTRRIQVARRGYKAYDLTLALPRGSHEDLVVPWRRQNGRDQVGRPLPADAVRSPFASEERVDLGQGNEPQDWLRARHRTRTIWGYSTLALGLAAAATAGALYSVGTVKGDTAHKYYMGATQPDVILHHWEEVQQAEQMLLAGHVLTGVGAAVIGLSLYLLLSRPELPGLGELEASAAPLPGGGAALGLGGRF